MASFLDKGSLEACPSLRLRASSARCPQRLALAPAVTPTTLWLRVAVAAAALTCCPMLLWAASPGSSSPRLQDVQKIPAVAVSNAPGDSATPQLAWIASNAGVTELFLATLDGKNAHEVALPGSCAATGLRWANGGYPLPRSNVWHELAVMTHCSDGQAPMRSVIWLLDARHADQPPRKIADLAGYAHCMQWTAQNKGVAFLYVPGARHPPDADTEGNCQSRDVDTMNATVSPTQRVSMVSLADGKVEAVTPAGINVYEYAWTTHGKQALLYVATQPGEARWNARLYRKWGDASPAQWVVIDPATSRQLHDRHISMASWGLTRPIVYFLGIKNAKDATAGNWYQVPSSGGTPVNLTRGADTKPSWVDSSGFGTRHAGENIQVLRLPGPPWARPYWPAKIFLSVPGTISDGRGAMAVSIAVAPLRVAFAEQRPGLSPEIRVAEFRGTEAPEQFSFTSTGTYVTPDRKSDPVAAYRSVSASLSSADGTENPLVSYPVISGIGVALTITPAGPQIFKVMPGSVAAISGKLHHGDLILAVEVDDRFTSLRGKSMGEVTNLIRGPVGTRIALRVRSRDGKAGTVVLTRKSIPLPVPSYYGLIGKEAPNTSFVSLQRPRPMRLSEYKGRIVFLDLWAPWCGTCYAPLNELQRIASSHPSWKGRVVFLAASVRSSPGADLRAIRQQGWNSITFLSISFSNMKAMGIEVVPTLLVINASGKIVAVGDPHAMSIESIVSDLLAHTQSV